MTVFININDFFYQITQKEHCFIQTFMFRLHVSKYIQIYNSLNEFFGCSLLYTIEISEELVNLLWFVTILMQSYHWRNWIIRISDCLLNSKKYAIWNTHLKEMIKWNIHNEKTRHDKTLSMCNGIKYCICDKDYCNSASTQSIIQMFTMITTAYWTKIVFA